jgi:DNA-directed RNA polymerase I, II, and III subunit RPABC3
MTTARAPTIFEDRFKVLAVNPDGKMYQRVSRIVCKSSSGVAITVDINSEIYSGVEAGQTLAIALARTINLDGTEGSNQYDHGVFQQATLMDSFEYVMHGLVFECNSDEKDATSVRALISFGGLLMKIDGATEALRDLQYNKHYYLLIRKVVS